jgi:hypothetical protein
LSVWDGAGLENKASAQNVTPALVLSRRIWYNKTKAVLCGLFEVVSNAGIIN